MNPSIDDISTNGAPGVKYLTRMKSQQYSISLSRCDAWKRPPCFFTILQYGPSICFFMAPTSSFKDDLSSIQHEMMGHCPWLQGTVKGCPWLGKGSLGKSSLNSTGNALSIMGYIWVFRGLGQQGRANVGCLMVRTRRTRLWHENG